MTNSTAQKPSKNQQPQDTTIQKQNDSTTKNINTTTKNINTTTKNINTTTKNNNNAGHCKYCHTTTPITCNICYNSYCNDRGTSNVSHIIFHLIKNKHKSVTVDGCVLKCGLCDRDNMFNLGYVSRCLNEQFCGEIDDLCEECLLDSVPDCSIEKNKYKNEDFKSNDNNKTFDDEKDSVDANNTLQNSLFLEQIHNTDPSPNNLSHQQQTTFMSNLVCRTCTTNPTKLLPIIQERCLVKQLCRDTTIHDTPKTDDGPKTNILSKRQLARLETTRKYRLPTVQLRYTLDEYMQIFSTLLMAECDQERLMKESLTQNDVKIRFEMSRELNSSYRNATKYNQILSGNKKLSDNVLYKSKNKINKGDDKSIDNYEFTSIKKSFYTYFHLKDADSKTSIGDEIKITSEDAEIQAFIVQNHSFTEEIKAKIYKVKGRVFDGDLYKIEYAYKSVCEERMMEALGNMKKMDSKMLGYILGTEDLSTNNNSNKYMNNSDNRNIINSNILRKFVGMNHSFELAVAPNLPTLNSSQEKAVCAALQNPLTLIQGPPGTGKTSTLAHIVYNLVQQNRCSDTSSDSDDRGVVKKVLVVASSNTAVDHLSEKIHMTGVKVLRVVSKRRENMQDDLSFLSLHVQAKILLDDEKNNQEEYSEDDNDCVDVIQEINEIDNKEENEDKKYRIKRRLIECAEVITCTCVGAGQRLFKRFKFPYVLIDEAVQCTEPLTIIPLVHGCEKLVLVGDHKQLGPIILDKDTALAGFKQTLFERLILLGNIPYLLNVQYRMHPALAEWPSNTFYNGSLVNGISETKRLYRLSLPFPTFFYVCYGREETSASGTSFLNQSEATHCEAIIKVLIGSGIKCSQIGVITPYEGQRAFILNKLRNIDGIDTLEVKNVDAFQGREKDYIIVSLVRSNMYQGIGFVSDARRLNVTLTRARYGCVIIGNPVTLSKNALWKGLIEYYQEKGAVFEGGIGDLRPVSVVRKKGGVDLVALFEAL